MATIVFVLVDVVVMVVIFICDCGNGRCWGDLNMSGGGGISNSGSDNEDSHTDMK